MSMETVAKTFKSNASAVVANLKSASTDIKTLVATRGGVVVLVTFVLAGVSIGHVL